MVIPGHNLGNSQVSVNRTIGPTLVSVWVAESVATFWEIAAHSVDHMFSLYFDFPFWV